MVHPKLRDKTYILGEKQNIYLIRLAVCIAADGEDLCDDYAAP
jgi:hypothetical protein